MVPAGTVFVCDMGMDTETSIELVPTEIIIGGVLVEVEIGATLVVVESRLEVVLEPVC